jgi:hypothetical protein
MRNLVAHDHHPVPCARIADVDAEKRRKRLELGRRTPVLDAGEDVVKISRVLRSTVSVPPTLPTVSSSSVSAFLRCSTRAVHRVGPVGEQFSRRPDGRKIKEVVTWPQGAECG